MIRNTLRSFLLFCFEAGLITFGVTVGSAQTVIGIGADHPATDVDSAGTRMNIENADGTYPTLEAGVYDVSVFKYSNSADTGELQPFLAVSTGNNTYSVLWVGPTAAAPGSNAIVATPYDEGTQQFSLDADAPVYAGFNAGGPSVKFGAGLTDHANPANFDIAPGSEISGFGHANLGRSYAFEIEVAPAAPPGPTHANGLIAYWPLDGDTTDAIGGYDGVPMGTNNTLTYDGGMFGGGVDLDGVNQFIQVSGDENVFDFGAPAAPTGFTISAWFRVDAFTKSWQCLIAKGEGNRWRVHRRGADSPAVFAANGGNADVPGYSGADYPIADGNFHHVAVVSVPGDRVELWLDGDLVSTGPAPALENGANPMMIGENPDARGRTWNGGIDDVAAWNRPLNADEIAAIWNNGDGKSVAALIAPPAPGLPIPGTVTILGAGTGALLGGDLTDPENDGGADADENYNAVFASSEEPGFGGGEFSYNVFDNRVGGGNDKWCCGSDGAPAFPDAPLWIQATFPEPIALTHFTITSANDTPGRDPVTWAIQGSNDGVSFDTIFEQDGSIWSERNQVARIDLDYASPGFTTFRFITYQTGLTTGARFQLAELEFFGRLAVGAEGPDSDLDGLRDTWEIANIGNLNSGANDDNDGDGLTNKQELREGTKPTVADTDGDGIPDGEEFLLGINPASADTDGDGLTDDEEVALGTWPGQADSDGDGYSDAVEVASSTDPLNSGSRPTTVTISELTVRNMDLNNVSDLNGMIAGPLANGSNIVSEVTVEAGSINYNDDAGTQGIPGDVGFPVYGGVRGADHNYIGLVGTGKISVPADGIWTFKTRSDDGSILRINGVDVVDDRTNHGAQDRFGAIALTAGTHAFEYLFYEQGGGANCELAVALTEGDHTDGSTASVSGGGATYVLLENPDFVLADSVRDFTAVGAIQGALGWENGYQVITGGVAGDFQRFPADWWNGSAWDFPGGNVPWTTIAVESVHPNGDNNDTAEPFADTHQVARRWTSSYSGDVDITWDLAKQNLNCGNGVTGGVAINGEVVDSVTIAFNDGTGVSRTIRTSIAAGDTVDAFQNSLGTDGSLADGCDGSVTRLKISAVGTGGNYAETVLGDSPVAYWRFEDGEGATTAADSGSAGKNGTVGPDGPAFGVPSASGQLGSSIEFSGPAAANSTGKFINTGELPWLTNIRGAEEAKATTVEYWIRTSQVGTAADQTWNSPSIFARESPGDGDMYWGWLDSQGRFGFSTSDIREIYAAPGTINDGNWHHVVMVKEWTLADPNKSTLHIDGGAAAGGLTLQAETAAGNASFQDADSVISFLGLTHNGGGGNVQFIGSLDEVAIYDRALTADQVAAHYATAGIIDPDSDGDGIPDRLEIAWFGNLSQDMDDDSDGDRAVNGDEIAFGTNPTIKDTDGDGLWDGEEWIEVPLGTLPSVADTDGDGLSDGDEIRITGTNPNNPDTDGDGISDAVEVANMCLYAQTFNGFADGTTNVGDGSVISSAAPFTAAVNGEALELTRDGISSQNATFKAPNLGDLGGDFAIAFDYSLAGGGTRPADGFSVNFGPIGDNEFGNPAEEGFGKGLAVEFDTWDSGADDEVPARGENGIGIDVSVDGVTKAAAREVSGADPTNNAFFVFDGSRHHVEIIYEEAVEGSGTPYDSEVMSDAPVAYWRFEECELLSVEETNLGTDAPAVIYSNAFGEDALSFSDRTHQHNGAAFDDAGLLSTSGTNIVPLPSYLVGQDYVAFANNARENVDFQAVIVADAPKKWYLLIDNRLDGPAGVGGGDNKTDPVLGGTLQWVIDGGWQRVNTGISPNGQADYTGVDEGGDGTGPGVALNQFYAVYTLPAPSSSVTIGGPQIGGNNMIALVAAAVAVDSANAVGDPTEVINALGALPTYDNRNFGAGRVDQKDATFAVDIDFDAHPGGAEQLIWESGGGTVGWSIVYAEGNIIRVRKAGRGGNNVSTLEYTLSQAQIDGGDINVSWTYDLVNGAGNSEQFLLINGGIVDRDAGDYEPDWTGGNGAAFGVATTAMAAGGGNTSITAADFTAGTINLAKGLRFFQNVASEPTNGAYNGIGLGVASASPALGTAAEWTGAAGSSNIDFGRPGFNHLAQLTNIDVDDGGLGIPAGDPNANKKTSVEFWMQTNQVSGNANNWRSPLVFGSESPGDGDVQWGWVTNTGAIGFALNDGGGGIYPGPVINDDQWHHIVQTYDWTTREYQLFLDGALAQSAITGTNVFQDTNGGMPRYLGWNHWVDAGAGANSPHLLGQFVGNLDEVAVYDRILSGDRVSAHFASGAPKPNRVTVIVDGEVILSEVPVPEFEPTAADRIAIAARTGGAHETLLIDNFCVVTGTDLPDVPMDPLDPNVPGDIVPPAEQMGLADVDSDRDGVLDNEERLAGTNPYDSGDFFRMSGVYQGISEDGSRTLLLDVSSVPGKTYVLQFSPTMGAGTWENVDVITADSPGITFEIMNPKAFQRREGFFRAILVELN